MQVRSAAEAYIPGLFHLVSEVQAVAEEEKFEGTWPQVSLLWIAGVRYAVPSKQGLAYCMACG